MSDLNPQLFELLQNRFDKQDSVLEDIQTNLKEHVAKDETYWRKLDRQDGQVSLLKWISGAMGSTGLLAWLYEHFSRH